METPSTNGQLPKAWKTEFAKMRPLIPAIFHVVIAVAIIVTGCFGEAGIGTPWWSGSMFLISGITAFILVLMKQTISWEKLTFIAIVLSTLIAGLAVILYSLEFALATLPRSPFPHHGLNTTQLVRHYKVTTAELALSAFQLGICSWIWVILQKARKMLCN